MMHGRCCEFGACWDAAVDPVHHDILASVCVCVCVCEALRWSTVAIFVFFKYLHVLIGIIIY